MKKFATSFALSSALFFSTVGAFAAEHAVTIKGFAFMPASLEVAVGDTVVFTNEDGAPHTATGGGFDTGTLKSGETGTVTISAAGEIDYKCNFHSSMKGKITAK
jgi:plastocyanin